MPVKCVIFDFEGTLADTFPLYLAAFNEILVERHKSPISAEDLAPLFPLANEEILRRLSFAEPEIPSLAASLVDRCISVLRSHPSTDPLPVLYEAKAFLRLPSVANLKIGIVTSSRRRLIEACLLHISFEHEIGCLIAREDCPKLKPAADPVLKCLETLGVCPADAIMIGDGRKDIEAARAACLQKAFLIAPPPKQDGPHDINSFGADVVIHSFRELAEKLEMPWEDALN